MRLSEKELPYRSFTVVHPKHFGLWSLFWTHDPFSAVFKSSICSVLLQPSLPFHPFDPRLCPSGGAQYLFTAPCCWSSRAFLSCFASSLLSPRKTPSQCFECHFCVEFARWVFSTKLLQSTWTEKVYSFKHPAVDWTLSSTISRTLTEVEQSVLP